MNANAIITGLCEEVFPTLPDACVHLLKFDPPFGLNMDYPDFDDKKPDYALIEKTLHDARRLLTPDASVWVQCGQRIQAKVYGILEDLGFYWQNSVPWWYEFGPYQKRKLAPCWQMFHWFSVHPKNYTFNGGDGDLRVPSKRQELGDKRADPRGRILPDVWDLKRIAGTFKERRGHCCQTNELADDLIVQLCSNRGDLVCDPMCGTGTALAMAKRHNRRWLGIEKCEATAEGARQRVANETPCLLE